MDIKKINERVENFLQTQNEEADFIHGDKGVKISGDKKEVSNLLTKLDQEYGDLTIPEFIDMLIEKEKSGEEILKENFNESEDTDVRAFLQLLGKFSKTYTYENGRYAYKQGEIYDLPTLRVFAKERQDEVELWATTSAYPEGVVCIGKITISPFYEGRVKIKDVYEVVLINNADNLRWDEWFQKFCYETMNFSKIYEVDSLSIPKERKYWANNILSELDLLIQDSLKNHSTKTKENLKKSDDLINKSQTLAAARREARANKKAANTTIKQALSKSSIAKKIQALQNPTPEQLARILAAIGE